MQKAELILAKLNQKSKSNKAFRFQRLYRKFFNPDFYLYAYSKIYRNEGNMTKGADGKTIDGFGKEMIMNIISELQQERYYPTPVKRKYIPKKNGKLRPLGIPTFKDKIVQEIIREILEAIYEPAFSGNSHGFRPNRSCQTALFQIKRHCTGTSWAIEGDIKGFFDNINHEIMINTLKQKIDDGRFIELIKRFLTAGYIENDIKYDSITGTPQGGIVSPVLANIYLNELDKYMETLIEKYTKGMGKRRKGNPVYSKLTSMRQRRLKAGKLEEANEIFKEILKTPSKAPIDSNFVRIKYTRYADDFVVFICGSKETAIEIREEINKFLKENLKLELNIDKTLITNILTNKVRFLGYEIRKGKDDGKLIKNIKGFKRRDVNGIIQLLVPADVINKKIKEFSYRGKPIHRNERINNPIIRIISEYNDEVKGLYNFYCMANNVSKRINKFKYYHYLSLIKTICRKEKLSIRKTLDKYGISVPRKDGTGTRKIIGIKYQTKNGERTLIYFNKSLRRIPEPFHYEINLQTGEPIGYPYCELILRLNRNICELCREEKTDNEIVVHHVRKLKDLMEKYAKKKKPAWVEVMEKLRRKTLIVCKECHSLIHRKDLALDTPESRMQ